MRWARCALVVLATASVCGAETIRLEPFVLGIPAVTKIANAGDLTGRLFFATQDGLVHVHDNGQLLPAPLLDLRGQVSTNLEDGLLGLAFHPDHASNGFFYVFYTKPDGNDVVVRYRTSAADPNVADPASAFVILDLPHPGASIHNGGELVFGPDGLLYVSTGDGAVMANAQSLASPLGKILRIDVDGGSPYAIPPGNPFVGVPGARGEILAYGLRNPWRMSFDRATGDLLIGDNGTAYRSEVDRLPPGSGGQNFGWPIMEGDLCYPPGTVCSPAGLTLPAFAIQHAAIIGGHRYRAARIGALYGTYVFGGFAGPIFGAREEPGGAWTTFPLLYDNFNTYSAFGEDESGDLLVARYQGTAGTTGVYRIAASSTPSTASLTGVQPVPATEGDTITWTVELSAAHLAGAVSVAYTTEDVTARAGHDYVAAQGVLTFEPGVVRRTVTVPTVRDAIHEEFEETFRLRLTDPSGVLIGVAQGTATIRDDDPAPLVTFDGCTITEGQGGPSTPCVVHLTLSPPSEAQALVGYFTVPITAAPPDYQAVSGTLTFPAGAMSRTVTVPVLDDALVESEETFGVSFSALSHATLPVTQTVGRILDDDTAPPAGTETAHGGLSRGDLASGPVLYRLAQAPRSSYELVLDEVSGDAAPAVFLERLAVDGATVLQSATAAPGRSAVHLRWQNPTDASIPSQVLRVRGTCPAGCGPDDRYRLRTFDTTLAGSRFNNAGSQASVLILHNLEPRAVSAAAWFWGPDGDLLQSVGMTLAPQGLQTIPLAQTPGLIGQGGTVTVSHDGGYGAVAGKVVALEPATGFAFDTPLQPRPR